jgi:hypothetical protein
MDNNEEKEEEDKTEKPKGKENKDANEIAYLVAQCRCSVS